MSETQDVIEVMARALVPEWHELTGHARDGWPLMHTADAWRAMLSTSQQK